MRLAGYHTVVCADDTDLFIMDECMKSSVDVCYESQYALTSCGRLLVATGGTLKPNKCFYYIIDYEQLDNGRWQYTEMMDRDLCVPCANGSEVTIEKLSVDISKTTLGIWTNPTGDYVKQLEVFTVRLTTWTDRLSARKLPSRWAWVSYF